MSPSQDILTDEEFEELIDELKSNVENPEEGFFGPGSTYWRIGRENVLGLGGVTALLLQLAHPMVAAGVDDHSNFEEDPQARLERTFRYVHRISFGDVDEAVETARKVREMHKAVKGTLPEEVEIFEEGESYHANRIDLLLWVYATLIDGAMTSYEAFVGPLSDDEKETYYQQSKIFAKLFGIPDESLPDTLRDFHEYYEKQIRSVIGTGEQGIRLKDTIIGQTGLLSPIVILISSGLMPDERLREIFDLPWNFFMDLLFRGFCAVVRALIPLMPPSLRYVKKYRKRLENLEGKDAVPSYIDQFLEGLPAPFDAVGIIRRLLRPIHSPI